MQTLSLKKVEVKGTAICWDGRLSVDTSPVVSSAHITHEAGPERKSLVRRESRRILRVAEEKKGWRKLTTIGVQKLESRFLVLINVNVVILACDKQEASILSEFHFEDSTIQHLEGKGNTNRYCNLPGSSGCDVHNVYFI